MAFAFGYKYKPKMRVKITLSLAQQNKYLGHLAHHFGVTESYAQPHTLYVTERAFCAFMFALEKKGICPTLKQIKAEYVDVKKETRITHVISQPSHGENDEAEGS